MEAEEKDTAAVILTGWCAVTTIILFRGFSSSLISLIPLAAAAGFSTGTVLFPFSMVFMILGLVSPEAAPWAALMGGALCTAAGNGAKTRTAGFLAVAAALWFVPLTGSVPLLVAAAAGAFFHRHRVLPYGFLAVGFMVSVLFTGLPRYGLPYSATASSEIENGTLTYHVPSLTLASPEVLLCVPGGGSWAMWIAVDGGGVRDTMPMMSLSMGETQIFLPSGGDTLCFTGIPGDTLSVALTRDHSPFNHPVVHISAGGERL